MPAPCRRESRRVTAGTRPQRSHQQRRVFCTKQLKLHTEGCSVDKTHTENCPHLPWRLCTAPGVRPHASEELRMINARPGQAAALTLYNHMMPSTNAARPPAAMLHSHTMGCLSLPHISASIQQPPGCLQAWGRGRGCLVGRLQSRRSYPRWADLCSTGKASAQPPTDAACRRTDGAGAAGLDSVRAAAAAGPGAAGRTTRAWWGTGACVGGGVSTQGARIAAAANAYSSVISSMVLAVGLPAHPAQPSITNGNHAWRARMREAAAQGLHHKRASMSVLFVVIAIRARETHKGHRSSVCTQHLDTATGLCCGASPLRHGAARALHAGTGARAPPPWPAFTSTRRMSGLRCGEPG